MLHIYEIKQYIADNYNIDTEHEIELLADEGNAVYLITSKYYKLIFRVYSTEKSIEIIKSEIELLNFLTEQGLNVETPIKNNAGQFHDTIKLNNTVRNCAMYRAFTGEVFDEILTYEQAEHLGTLTARFHNAADLYKGQSSFNDFGYEGLVSMPWRTIKPFVQHNQELYRFYEQVITSSEELMKKHESLLSWGLCHGDIHVGNVMFDKVNIPGLFDFDLCCKGWRLYDIATFIWSILPREDYSEETVNAIDVCIKGFLEGYQKHRALSQAEQDLLFCFVLLRHIWRQAVRIEFEKPKVEWRSEQHFIIQAERMKKWIELYGIKL